MSISSEQYDAYLPLYLMIPEKWEEARQVLVESIKRIANEVNIREIGWLLPGQYLNGQQFSPVSGNGPYRAVFRSVISMGALPNDTTLSVAHGLTVNANFTLLHMYGAATNPTSNFPSIPIPYSSSTLNQNIILNMDETNINITTSIDYSDYTVCNVVVEFIQQT